MDTKPFEKTGVAAVTAAVTSALLKCGILVANPDFDQLGSDLMVFTSVDKRGFFGRIQAKYRNLKSQASVVIPTDYIKGAIGCFYLPPSWRKKPSSLLSSGRYTACFQEE